MRSSPRKSTKSAARSKRANKNAPPSAPNENILQLRSLAHDLSNSLEAILQACYLLGHAKVDADSRRWIQLIDQSSQDAARINREIRKALRALSGEV
jgi:hypothetical protein